MRIITARKLNLLNFCICCGLVAFAYYLQLVMNLQPCPLCMLERWIFISMAVTFLLAVIQNPDKKGQQMYGVLLLLLAILGMFFSGRHLWLQGQPSALGEICVPGLVYLLKTVPFSQVLKVMLLGSSDCAKVDWSFLGLSLAGWTFLFFDLFALLGLALIKGLFYPKEKP